MLNLALDLRELALLSALAQEPPAAASPLRRLCAAALQRPWGELLAQSLPAFLEQGIAQTDPEGRPRLSPEMEEIFGILHAPEQVLSLGRQGSLAVGETLACRQGGGWALLALPRDAELVLLTGPLDREQLKGWFVQELWGGVSLDEGDLPGISLDLALGELLILLGLQAIYRQRAAQATPLEGAALWVSAPDLAALTPPEILSPWAKTDPALPVSAEAVCGYLANDDHRQQTAARMVERGILWATRDSWALSEELRPLLDPGLLQDAIAVRDLDGGPSALFHILGQGCLLLEASPVSPLHVRLTSLPGPLDPAHWFDELVPEIEIEAAAPEEPAAEPSASGASPHCSRCGAELQPDQRFCGNCGAPTGRVALAVDAPVCPACQALVPAHARFCPECGAPLAAQPD